MTPPRDLGREGRIILPAARRGRPLETFVDASRRGTSCRAAKWIELGVTTGRGRQDRTHAREEGKRPTGKKVVTARIAEARKAKLRAEKRKAAKAAGAAPQPAAARWSIEVFHRTIKSGCKSEDRRLGLADRIEACPWLSTSSSPAGSAGAPLTRPCHRRQMVVIRPFGGAQAERFHEQPEKA